MKMKQDEKYSTDNCFGHKMTRLTHGIPMGSLYVNGHLIL